MVNTARAQKRELEIDEMIISLVDHDRRLQFSEETKALAIKLSNNKISEKGKSQEIPTPPSSALAAKKHRGKSPCDHCGSARHDKKSCYFFLSPDEGPPGWKPFAGKEHLLKENMAGKRIATSVKSMKVALTVNSKSTKDAGFYLDSAADVHKTYDRLLFSTYSEVQLSPIRMADNSKLRVLGKGTVSLTVMIDDEALQVYLLNVLHSPDLEYNLLSIGTIEDAGYSVLAKNGKMTVFDN